MQGAIAVDYLNIATQTNNDSTISIEHNLARYPPYRDLIVVLSCSWCMWLMREIKRKQERARRLLACGFLSAEMQGVDDFPLSRRLMLIRELSRRRRNTRRISFPGAENLRCIARVCLSVSLETARDFIACGTSCIATYVCTNTPTRDGHAPKRSLITSILLLLTAHYRASRESFLLIYVDCRSRKRVERDHQEFAPPLETRAPES